MSDIKLKIVSNIPGRIRIKSKEIYKNDKLGKQILSTMKSYMEIYDVKYNIYSSNILIIYDNNKITICDILESIKQILLKKKYISLHNYEASINTIKNKSLGLFYKFRRSTTLLNLSIIGSGLLAYYKNYKKVSWIILFTPLLNNLLNFILFGHSIRKLSKKTSSKSSPNYLENIIKSTHDVGGEIKLKLRLFISCISIFGFAVYAINLSFISLLSLVLASYFLLKLSPIDSVLYWGYHNRLSHGVHLNDVSSSDKLSTTNTIIFFVDNSDIISLNLVEKIRESGILDIKVVSDLDNPKVIFKANRLNIDGINKNHFTEYLSKQNSNQTIILDNGTMKYYHKLKSSNRTCITIVNDLYSPSEYVGDILTPYKNINEIVTTIDFSKYQLQKIYQNYLFMIWSYFIEVFLFTKGHLNILITWLVNIIINIIIYSNSYMTLEYKTVYI